MKLAQIILPTIGNDGSDLTDCHVALRSTLADSFGGYTATSGQGGWTDSGKLYQDPVTVYAVAMDDTAENRAKLESVALFYGHMATQHCVMVTHASGEVAFVECRATVTEGIAA